MTGFGDYLEARAGLHPTPPRRAKQATAERVECGATKGDETCHRAAGHTGPHEAAVRRGLAGEGETDAAAAAEMEATG